MSENEMMITQESEGTYEKWDVAIRNVCASYAIARYWDPGWSLGSITSKDAVCSWLEAEHMERVYIFPDTGEDITGVYRERK